MSVLIHGKRLTYDRNIKPINTIYGRDVGGDSVCPADHGFDSRLGGRL